MPVDVPVVDADAHVYEPPELWTEYLSRHERHLAEETFWHQRGPDGSELTVVNGRAVRSLNRTRLNRFACFSPGASVESISDLDLGDAHENPAAWDGPARVRDLDALGVSHQVVFPTLFAEHFPVVDNPPAAEALARAYNEWVLDFASAAPDRLHPVGILPLQSVPGARREIERLVARGVGSVLVRPAFHRGRYLNHSDYLPIWQAIAEAGLVAAVHPSAGSTNPEFTSAGAFVERVAGPLGIGHDVAAAIAPVQDNMNAVLALAYYGHREDHPSLRIALCHSGAAWFELVLEKAETYLWLFPPGTMPVSLEPGELWFGDTTLVTFDAWEDSIGMLADTYAGVAAWGSRYPQHDASTPAEATAMLDRNEVTPATIAALMGGNAARLYGITFAEPARV